MAGTVSRRLRAIVLAAALLLAPCASLAEPVPEPQQIALPAEREALNELQAILALGPDKPTLALPRLDALLARLNQPTRLRGFVQLIRASALDALRRPQDARPAVDEAVRLLPGYSGPLLLAMQIEVYSDRAPQAVEHLVRASRIDPEIVRGIPDFEVHNLLLRLSNGRHDRHIGQLATRLFEIGWTGDSLPLRSRLAARLIEQRVAEGDTAGARAAIPNLLNPTDVHGLLADKRYEALWPALEQWAGPRHERLWAIFLPELRDKWMVAHDLERGRAYLTALDAAERHEVIVAEFLPLFSKRLERERDYDLLWIASPLAGALARLGRWEEVEALFTRALETWPAGSDPNALNLSANRGRFRYYRGDAPGAIADLRAAIAESQASGGIVSASALAGMHLYLACALHTLGRDSDAFRSIGVVRASASPNAISELYLCLDRPEQARDALIAALEREALRGDVIELVQPSEGRAMQPGLGKTLWLRREALRKDETLLDAIRKYGRVIPYPPSAGAAAVSLTAPVATPAAPSPE